MIGQCKCGFVGKLTKDHIIPRVFYKILAKYGLKQNANRAKNIEYICTNCNNKKGHRLEKSNEEANELLKELFMQMENGVYVSQKDISIIRQMLPLEE